MLTAVAALKTVEVPPRPEATVNDEETALLSGSGETSGNTSKAHPGRLAGMVGFASGCGALLAGLSQSSSPFPFDASAQPLSSAVFVFLRLPNHLSLLFTERGENFDVDVLALQCTFYIIALVALGEALLLALLFPKRTRRTSVPPSSHLNQRAGSRIVRGVSGLFEGFRLASRSGEVALGYGTSFAVRLLSPFPIPGFLALTLVVRRLEVKLSSSQLSFPSTSTGFAASRLPSCKASSLTLSPLQYLNEHDLCDSARSLASNSCRRGFILSSILTGSIQLLALLLSPLLGYLSTCPTSFFFRLTRRNKSNPQAAVLALSFFFGALSFLGFAFLPNQGDPRAGVSWIYVVGLGIAQAAGVVLSLALVTSGSGAIAAEEGKEVGGALAGSYALSGGAYFPLACVFSSAGDSRN